MRTFIANSTSANTRDIRPNIAYYTADLTERGAAHLSSAPFPREEDPRMRQLVKFLLEPRALTSAVAQVI